MEFLHMPKKLNDRIASQRGRVPMHVWARRLGSEGGVRGVGPRWMKMWSSLGHIGLCALSAHNITCCIVNKIGKATITTWREIEFLILTTYSFHISNSYYEIEYDNICDLQSLITLDGLWTTRCTSKQQDVLTILCSNAEQLPTLELLVKYSTYLLVANPTLN